MFTPVNVKLPDRRADRNRIDATNGCKFAPTPIWWAPRTKLKSSTS